MPGSTNVEISETLRPDTASTREMLSGLSEDRTEVVVRTALTAELAADHLREMGYDIPVLACNPP